MDSEYFNQAQINGLINRIRWTVILFMLPFMIVATVAAVMLHDMHLHNDHTGVVEGRLRRLECHNRLEPGRDTSTAFPFAEGQDKQPC